MTLSRFLVGLMAVFLLTSVALASDGWLGVTLQDLSTSMAKALDLDSTDGVLVSSVIDDSPAAKAGLQDGDVIVAFGGDKITSSKDLTRAVADADPGDKVKVTVMRAGKSRDIDVTIGEREDNDKNAPMLRWFDGSSDNPMIIKRLYHADGGYLGVGLQDLTDQLGDVFGVKDGKGALISEVKDDSPAAKSDLKAGDVIVKFGDEDITSSDELREAVADAKPGDEVKIDYVRQGKTRHATVTLAERPEGADDDMGIAGLRLPHVMQFMRQNKDQWRVLRDEKRDRHDEQKEMQELRDELRDLRQQLEQMQKELNSR